MAKVYSYHEIDLHPGVTAEEFERFLQKMMAFGDPPGMRVYYMRGDRGQREGKFIHLVEFDSAERRDELYPSDGTESEEVLRYRDPEQLAPLVAEWRTLASMPGEAPYTDYVELQP